MKLLVISGKKRSGKDTSADYLMNKYDSTKYQLAGPIKEALAYSYNHISIRHNRYIKNSLIHPILKDDDWGGTGVDRELDLELDKESQFDIFMCALDYLSTEFLELNYDAETVKQFVINNNESMSMRRFMQALGTDLVVNKFDRMYWMKLFALSYTEAFGNDKELFVVPDVRQTFEIGLLRAMGATVVHVVRPEQTNEPITDKHITEAGLLVAENDIMILNDSDLESLYNKLNQI